MNLVIDVGNTLVKIAVFDRGQIISIDSYNDINEDVVNDLLDKFPGVKACIVGSVRDLSINLKSILPEQY